MKNDETELNVNLIINNLNIGDTLSYKDLCEKLNQPYYRGNQKNAQLKEFKRYFNFENVNRKIIITDIYDESLDPQARAVPKNAIYVKYISCVLLDHLSKQDGYRIYITKTKLWLLLGIITENYIKYNKNRKELKKLSNKMTDFEIREFFKRCNNNFPKIITSSLNSLQRRNLIKYSEPYVIVEKDSNGKIEHREAMDSEVAYIIKTKRKIMKQFGVEVEIQIYWNGQEDEYFATLNNIFKKEKNWESVYICYKIVYDQEDTLEAFSEDAVKLCKLILNEKVINRMDTQADNLLENSRNNPDSFQYPIVYPNMQHMLSNKLLKLEDIEGLMKKYLEGDIIGEFDTQTL